MHACPCGYYGDRTRECRCTPAIIQRYLSKISGPLLDRIDIQIEVPAVPYKEPRAGEESESSGGMRERVRAREVQPERGHSNARMPARLIRRRCALDETLDETEERTLEMAMRKLSLSARARPNSESSRGYSRSGQLGECDIETPCRSCAVSQSGPELLELAVLHTDGSSSRPSAGFGPVGSSSELLVLPPPQPVRGEADISIWHNRTFSHGDDNACQRLDNRVLAG
jgi:hypothetical protein